MRCVPQPNQSDTAPAHLAFPPEGSAEFERFLSMARDGRIPLGTIDDGAEAVWDTQVEAHALLAGATGSGKTAAATLPIFAALCCPDVFDLIVVEPTGEFAWTAQFSNVRQITDLDEASACIETLRNELSDRHELIKRRQEPNLKLLRDMYARNPELEAEDGPAPKRLLVVLHDFDVRGLTEEAKAALLDVSRLSRAVEVNLLVTVQQPTSSILSTQLRNMLPFRLCFGNVDKPSSIATLGHDRAATGGSGGPAPRGRAWLCSGRTPQPDPVVQVPFLPMTTQPSPWDSSIELEGAEERATHHQPVSGDTNDGATS
ncbi:FtsK/SpoIIIE domain-containing protein [Prescottella agglutinans]|uniref:DNA segregation ATPase FtsK/SpoIIIE-like protein n=1 Tax=Prescottella agglutinans TaxID=1644129 RepID=A0ABT6MIZ9_9NOCA|nr:FtsK/SpoIIIE domain-containing protein [Prescottella agglutinans]MDH6284303.1 DNA segregation ATPase FtsK/SpoIIIE-like protein [Prescottella agglutinans]